MRHKTTLAFLILAVASAAAFLHATESAKIERTVEKTFPVSSGVTLSVETFGGNVCVEPGDVQSVRIVARQVFPGAATDAEADEISKSLDLVMEQSGNSVHASSKYTGNTWRLWGSTPVYVSFEVTVPRACDATLATSGGNVRAGDLTGSVQARTSGGNVTLGKIDGMVDARTSGGNVTLAGCTHAAILKTSGGNVEAGPVAGNLQITTSGGHIKITRAEGAVHAHTSGGHIEADFARITAECELGTSGGGMNVQLPKSSALLLDAKTTAGHVRANDNLLANLQTDTPADAKRKSRLSGKINGGGPLVKLHTTGGNINVNLSEK